MKVVPIVPRGYCPGVVNAIDLVNKVLADQSYPRPIYLLGMIVHNQHIVDHFNRQGVITLDDTLYSRLEMVDKIEQGTLIITAHGVGDDVIDKIKKKGLTFVNATCKEVIKTHDLVKHYLNLSYRVAYIGKNHHPETEGILSIDPSIVLLETIADLDKLTAQTKPLFVTNQTTLSIHEIKPILSAIKTRFPESVLSDEICNSTRIRQEALLSANEGVDLCIVVGDPRSNNTASLVKISQDSTHTRTVRISDVFELTDEMLNDVKTVSVTSGASTPSEITNKVIEYLRNYSK